MCLDLQQRNIRRYTQITENHHNIVKRRHALMFVRQFSLFVSFCLHHEYKIYPRERLVSVTIKWQEEKDVELDTTKLISFNLIVCWLN